MSTEKPSPYDGMFAVNGGRRIAIISGIKISGGVKRYLGKALDGRPWRCEAPLILNIDDQDILRKVLAPAKEAVN